MAKKNASVNAKVDDLRRQMDYLSEKTTPLLGEAGQQAGEAATAAAEVAQQSAAQLADLIRRQPMVALAIGIIGAYALGRLVGAVRR